MTRRSWRARYLRRSGRARLGHDAGPQVRAPPGRCRPRGGLGGGGRAGPPRLPAGRSARRPGRADDDRADRHRRRRVRLAAGQPRRRRVRRHGVARESPPCCASSPRSPASSSSSRRSGRRRSCPRSRRRIRGSWRSAPPACSAVSGSPAGCGARPPCAAAGSSTGRVIAVVLTLLSASLFAGAAVANEIAVRDTVPTSSRFGPTGTDGEPPLCDARARCRAGRPACRPT